MYRTLRDFISDLEAAGELRRVSAPVSPILEISAIANRVSRMKAPSLGTTGPMIDPEHSDRGGVALLFENVEGVPSDVPIAINLFGSYRRMELAIGCHAEGPLPGGFEAIADRIASLVKLEPPSGLAEMFAAAKRFLPLLKIPPKVVRRGICQEVVHTGEAVDLFTIPMIKCWPLDGDLAGVDFPTPADHPDTAAGEGRYITLAGMYTIHADDAGKEQPPSRNVGMYRAQLIDSRRLAMHWHVHHDGAAHWRSWKERGERMPVAIALGGESVLPYAATAPLPPGMSELLMAGFLYGSAIPLVPAKTVPLHVPASAEIVIEGFVSVDAGGPGFDPHADGARVGPGAVLEGPFGDHTGFYSLPDRYPIMEVTAITHRKKPIYPTTIVGLPPQEDYYLGKATERLFLPLLKTVIPDILDYDLPMFSAFHNCVVVKIKKAYALQARRVMHAIWGAGQIAWTKMIIVVDEEVDIHRLDPVLQAIANTMHFARDIELVNGPLDILDHAAPFLGGGGKIGFDATRKIRGEEIGGIPIDNGFADQARSGDVSLLQNVPGVGRAVSPKPTRGRMAFITINDASSSDPRQTIEAILRETGAGGWLDFVIAFDSKVDIENTQTAMFHFCANTDPGRDMIRLGSRIGFDATTKDPSSPSPTPTSVPVRRYPPILEMPDEITDRINARWDEYGLSDLCE